MERFFLITLIIMLAKLTAVCQVNFSMYSSLTLTDNLKKDANAVYRLDEGILDVLSPSKYTFTTHQVITLLNKDAAYHLSQRLYYNKFKKIENVVFKIYNAAGELLRNFQKKDFKSRDYTDEMSLYTDDKILYLEAASPGYPCTVEIICEEKATGYVELPDWVVATPAESVEYSSFTVQVPPSLAIRYQALNIDLKPSIDSAAGKKMYTWTTKNITASRPEMHSYASHNLAEIKVVAASFEYDGYKGELKSWQTFGAWNYQFYEEAKPFNTNEIQNIQALVAECKTAREKIKTLYTFLEKNMRYVSIQLGIGGFKPFPVKYVNDKKYGDCKALTNYMRYLLKAVGINSYPALINAGYNKAPADINFPADPFNHVILCVPLEKDSIWLECTSNNNEYGFLGSFTENKNALLLTENGGVLVATPKSNFHNNLLNTKTIIKIDVDGSSEVTSHIFCTGDFWNVFYQVMNENKDQQKNIFINYLHYKVPEQFTIEPEANSANGKQFALSLSYDQQYDFKTGDKLFFRARLNMLCDEDIRPVTQRRFDYLFNFPYSKTDTTIYILPPGFVVDKLPAKKELTNQYASFTNEYSKEESGSVIKVIANLTLKKRLVPPADYPLVANLFQEVKKIENEKFIVKIN